MSVNTQTKTWDAVVEPSVLSGSVDAIVSKSAAHRALILAALADKPCDLVCPTTSRDIEATCDCLRALGAQITRDDDTLHVVPIAQVNVSAALDCGESGSTLRFMLPVACALGAGAILDGHGRLPQRPLSPLRELLEEHGCELSKAGEWPVRTTGCLSGGVFRLRGDVSSQFVTGLLLAAPVISQDVTIMVEPPVESRPYIDLTVDVLGQFGVPVDCRGLADGGLELHISASNHVVSPGRHVVEADWSNAAFWLVAGAIGEKPVTVCGLRPDSTQGDRAVVDILKRFGASVTCASRPDGLIDVTAAPGHLQAIELDAADIPDLTVPLCLVASCATGQTRVINAGRLRAKESDRLATVAELLRNLGVEVQEGPDWLDIQGKGADVSGDRDYACLRGCTISSHNDHRIAMTAAIAATRASGPIKIAGANAVEKSYPAFFEDFRSLGGRVEIA